MFICFTGKKPVADITLTFLESHYPKILFYHLEKIRNYTVEEKQPGIYYVKGDILSIQIIDSRKKVFTMNNSGMTLEQVFEEAGLTAKWEARAKETEALAIAKNLVNLGLPIESIVYATKLDMEKVKKLYPKS